MPAQAPHVVGSGHKTKLPAFVVTQAKLGDWVKSPNVARLLRVGSTPRHNARAELHRRRSRLTQRGIVKQ